MLLEKFDPPGFLRDFDDEQAAAWSEFISQQFDEAAAGFPNDFDFDAPRAQFFNPTTTEIGEDAQHAPISWTAFPRNVTVTSVGDLQRWRRAESSRDLQDEYCEWSVERDPETDKITRITFTCEGPEYWQFLANTNPDKALELYQEFVSEAVQMEDLFLPNGRYNPRNRWNNSTTGGAMHLIQRNNTLGAEIELAAGASVVREIGGRILTGEDELIRCGQYGGVQRHSDPHIGGEVNGLTRQKADVTLANPVGLYFNDLNVAGWESPDDTDPKSFWTYVRGNQERGFPVRAVYEVPAEKPYTVGDIKIGGREIRFAAQIADFISIKLVGIGTRFGQSTVQPMTGCRRLRPQPPSDALQLSVQDFLGTDTGKTGRN